MTGRARFVRNCTGVLPGMFRIDGLDFQQSAAFFRRDQQVFPLMGQQRLAIVKPGKFQGIVAHGNRANRRSRFTGIGGLVTKGKGNDFWRD